MESPLTWDSVHFSLFMALMIVRERILSQGRVKYHHNKKSGGKANGADI